MREYIVFLLGADTFDISSTIRYRGKLFGMDTLYDDCCYIADKFLEYDKRNEDIMGEYESLCNFLEEYADEIDEFLNYGITFDIGEE